MNAKRFTPKSNVPEKPREKQKGGSLAASQKFSSNFV
jgi:hypothetical protein